MDATTDADSDENLDAEVLKSEVLAICEQEYARAFGELFIPASGLEVIDGKVYGSSSAGLWLLKRWEAQGAPMPATPSAARLWDPEKRQRFAAERDGRASNAEIETEARRLYVWVREQVTAGLTDLRHARILQRVQAFRSRMVPAFGMGGLATTMLHTIEGLFLSPESKKNWRRARNWALRTAAARPTFENNFLRVYPKLSALESRFSAWLPPPREPFAAFVALVEQEAAQFPMSEQLQTDLSPRLIAVLAMLCDVDPDIWVTHRNKSPKETIKAVTQRVRAIQSRASSKTDP